MNQTRLGNLQACGDVAFSGANGDKQLWKELINNGDNKKSLLTEIISKVLLVCKEHSYPQNILIAYQGKCLI